MNTDQIETKLTAARTKLILDKPFLGALVLRLPMVAADKQWCPTTATDARKFYYNPEYIGQLSMAQTQYMLAHEALHCALSHFARRQHRVKHLWDLACDYAINPLLMEDGLTPPPNTLFMPQYEGMTAEEIYPLIDENDETETLDQHLYDQDNQSGGGQQGKPPPKSDQDPQKQQKSQPGQDSQQQDQGSGQGGGDQDGEQEKAGQQAQPGQNHPQNRDRDKGQDSGQDDSPEEQQGGDGAAAPPPLTEQERETLDVQWQQRLAGAAQQAMQAGKFGGSMARMIDHLLQPQLPWRMLLARYMTALARDDFSYTRPSRREGDAILPSLRSSQLDIVIAVDTSGSVKAREMDEFLSEISALKGQMRARVTLLACDSNLAPGTPWVFEPWEDFDCPAQIAGGGGTDFRPVFEWTEREGAHPDLLVYFTDAEGRFPPHEPNFPVIWLVKGKEKVPWGQRIQLN